jgi:hypothetical protein
MVALSRVGKEMTFPRYSLHTNPPVSEIQPFASDLAFFPRLLSIMTGAYRGLGPPGRKSASRLSSLIASALPLEVAKKCLLTA